MSKLTNKERIQKCIDVINKKETYTTYIIGCWDNKMEKLSNYSLAKVLDKIKHGNDTGDVDLSINRKPYVLEYCVIEGEKEGTTEIDFSLISKEEYISRYGDERYNREGY